MELTSAFLRQCDGLPQVLCERHHLWPGNDRDQATSPSVQRARWAQTKTGCFGIPLGTKVMMKMGKTVEDKPKLQVSSTGLLGCYYPSCNNHLVIQEPPVAEPGAKRTDWVLDLEQSCLSSHQENWLRPFLVSTNPKKTYNININWDKSKHGAFSMHRSLDFCCKNFTVISIACKNPPLFTVIIVLAKIHRYSPLLALLAKVHRYSPLLQFLQKSTAIRRY